MTRGAWIRIRLTEAEDARLREAAKESGRSRSAYLRESALARSLKADSGEAETLRVLRRLRRELRKQGSNFWQILDVCVRCDAVTGEVEKFIDEQQIADSHCRIAEEYASKAILGIKEEASAAKRDKAFLLRVSAEEKAALASKAEKAGLSLSDALRAAIACIETPDPGFSLEKARELTDELIAVGRKYNTIAHTLNQAVVAKRRENVTLWLSDGCDFEKRRHELLIAACALFEGRL